MVEVTALAGHIDHFGARPNQAHLAAHDVEQLRKLVEAQPAQQPTEAGVARVVVVFVFAAAILVVGELELALASIRAHRAELVDREGRTFNADALLAVQDALAKASAHRNGNDRHDWQRAQEGEAAEDDVEGSLDTSLVDRSITDDPKIVRVRDRNLIR